MKKAKPTDKELVEHIKWYAEENITFNKGKTFEEFQTLNQSVEFTKFIQEVSL